MSDQPRRLTPADEPYIRQFVPSRGHRWVAEKLGVSPMSVWHFADRRGIRIGDLAGYRRLSDVAVEAGSRLANIYERAESDGVIRRIKPPGHRIAGCVLVPKKWAEDFIREQVPKREAADLLGTGWLKTPEAAALLGVRPQTLKNSRVGGPHPGGRFGQLLRQANVEHRLAASRDGGTTYAWHPHGIDRLRVLLDKDRAMTKRMTLVKALAVEGGVSPSYAATVARRHRLAKTDVRLLFTWGKALLYVSDAVAEDMRAHFERTAAKGRRGPNKRPRMRRAA